ncbi:MAG: alpha/beta hydrolase [SAR324 cluster bacterium]|nr:alpha/beta hydrolase [SAR324 cluster bacterium]
MEVKEGFVESEGHRLGYLAVNEHLLSHGNQPIIVFIHGVLASINFWRDCVPPSFKEDRVWYSLSLPAHHPSTVPQDFKPEQVNDQWFFNLMNGALKELLGDKKAIIVGHSTGGFSAINLAIHQAPNVMGIISVAGFHSGKWGGAEGLLVKLAGLGKWAKSLFVANLTLSRTSSLMQRLFSNSLAHDQKAYGSNPLSRRMLDNIKPNVSQQNYSDLFPLFNGISRLEIADQLGEISMPCYIFAGTHDPIVPPKQSLLLSGKIPGATTVVFHNVGHMPFIEDTDNYFSALEEAVTNIHKQSNNR